MPAAAPAEGDAGTIYSSLSDAAAPAADGAGPFSALFSAFSEAFTEGLQPSPLKGRANEQSGDNPGLLSPGAQLRADAQRRMVRRASFNGSSSSASTSPDPAVAAAAAARRDRDLAEEKAIRERAARKEGEKSALLHAGAPRSDELTVAKLASSKLSDGVLRGIPLPTLMRGAGRIFAENGEAARRDPRGTYALSVPTESLDFFVSHSWRCPRIFKYLALLVHFNLRRATKLSVAVLFFLWSYALFYFDDLPSWGRFEGAMPVDGVLCVQSITVAISSVPIFLFFLFFCHVFRSDVRLFLDISCISQEDEAQKQAGISSLGAILDRSETLLVLCDGSYWSRLWCAAVLPARVARRSVRLTPTGLPVTGA